MKLNFFKNEVVTGTTPFFVIGPFCTNIGFWYGSFVWKDAFSILLLPAKKRSTVFWKNFSFEKTFEKTFRFPKNEIVLKLFKITTDCKVKTCRSQTLGYSENP